MSTGEALELKQKFFDGMSFAACTVNVVTTDGSAGRAGVTVSAMASVSVAKETATVFRSEGHPWPIPRSSLALVTPNSHRFFVG